MPRTRTVIRVREGQRPLVSRTNLTSAEEAALDAQEADKRTRVDAEKKVRRAHRLIRQWLRGLNPTQQARVYPTVRTAVMMLDDGLLQAAEIYVTNSGIPQALLDQLLPLVQGAQ